jgi:hypothetical protein
MAASPRFVAAALDHLAVNEGRPKRGSISLLIIGDEEGVAVNATLHEVRFCSTA